MRTHGQSNGHLFPKWWPLSNPNQIKSIMNKHQVKLHRNSDTKNRQQRTTSELPHNLQFVGYKYSTRKKGLCVVSVYLFLYCDVNEREFATLLYLVSLFFSGYMSTIRSTYQRSVSSGFSRLTTRSVYAVQRSVRYPAMGWFPWHPPVP